jgi:hypothetical protein
MNPKKMLTRLLLLASLTLLLSGCSVFSFLSGPNCDSVTVRRSGNLATGRKPADATNAKLCVDRTEYNTGDTVHMTFTVKNLLDEQIVIGNDQQPVMDLCVEKSQCLSQSQPEVAQLTRLTLEPGQSHTIQWDWPTPDVNLPEALGPINVVTLNAYWIDFDKGIGRIFVLFNYGPRKGMP